MERYGLKRDRDGTAYLEVPYRGARLLAHPLYAKGTAFTPEERSAFALQGLLPAAVSTMDQQVRRVYANIVRKQDPQRADPRAGRPGRRRHGDPGRQARPLHGGGWHPSDPDAARQP